MRRLAVLLALTGCIVTHAPALDERPRWQLVNPARWERDCASARAFVRKSGKAGFGVSVELRSVRDCRVVIGTSQLVFPDGAAIAVRAPGTVELPGRSIVHVWIPVTFDNDAAWDARRNDANLELAMQVGGASDTFVIPVVQR